MRGSEGKISDLCPEEMMERTMYVNKHLVVCVKLCEGFCVFVREMLLTVHYECHCQQRVYENENVNNKFKVSTASVIATISASSSSSSKTTLMTMMTTAAATLNSIYYIISFNTQINKATHTHTQ